MPQRENGDIRSLHHMVHKLDWKTTALIVAAAVVFPVLLFALIRYGIVVHDPDAFEDTTTAARQEKADFGVALYQSIMIQTTVGVADSLPISGGAKAVTALQALTTFVILASVVALTLYH